MSHNDTKIGGANTGFPLTKLSAIKDLDSNDAAQRNVAWEKLIAAYWKPVYKYLRIRWQLSNENAKDSTQAFFTTALEKSYFNSYSSEKSRFRTFLRVCLDRFITNQIKSDNREKRGGGAFHMALDFESVEGEITPLPVTDGKSAEDYFEREWMRSLFQLSLEQYRDWCRENNKTTHFNIFSTYDLHDSDTEKRPSYKQLAQQHGLPETQVTNYLAAARRQFRQVVLNNLREITADDNEFRLEARVLFGVEPQS